MRSMFALHIVKRLNGNVRVTHSYPLMKIETERVSPFGAFMAFMTYRKSPVWIDNFKSRYR